MTPSRIPDWLTKPFKPLDKEAEAAARHRQTILTKPPGALGRLEDIAILLASQQGNTRPQLEHIHITVFAGDHGVVNEGVSAFPQVVTGEMIRNFAQGGAAISVLARQLMARLEVVNLGVVNDPGPLENVRCLNLGPGTANFTQVPAMTSDQLTAALQAGWDSVEQAKHQHSQLFIGGEMGIGNTTSASALACALLNEPPIRLAGPGTGLDKTGIHHKAAVIERALILHGRFATHPQASDPLEILRRLGGFEIAALTGAYLACAQLGLTALVDGFISSTAALIAERLCPGAGLWQIYSHTSAEPGHRRILEALTAQPLLDLGLRLGEGSGAALVVPLLRLACDLHNEMATFSEASVSTGKNTSI